jgi:GH15 family glucan-1,4-alpha-glucosidase
VRGEPQHFTASKVLCWVALDRGIKLAEARGDEPRARKWREVAERIHAEVCERGVDERGVFTQHYDTDELDASLLLIPMMGFLPASDERVRATVLAIADELTEHGLVLRYKVEHTDDGLHGEEGTFAICSFWLVSALALIGETGRARELCEKMLSFASPLLLYAEEIDSSSGRHLGNFPQAFTHLSLINAVMDLLNAEAEEPVVETMAAGG